MKNIAFVLSLLFIGLLSCKTASKVDLSKVVKSEGEIFEASKVLTYDDVLKKLEKANGTEEVVVEAKVTAVCQKKGCWMNIVSEKNATAPEMFVKFKDYGFFMPLDLAGGRVIMKGNAYKEETSVDELKHLAEDGGKSKEEIAAITKPKVEYKFMASGVKILK